MITSPTWEPDYEHTWELVASDVDDRVVVRFLDVSMAEGDSLALLDGQEMQPFRVYPDIPLDAHLFSRSRELSIDMRTGGDGESRGFMAVAWAAQRGSTCSYHHSVMNLSTGDGHETILFESPNFGGSGRYLPDLECLFNLVVPESKRIKLEFLGPIDVTPAQDRLTIYDGIRKEDGPMDVISGHIEQPRAYSSRGNRLSVSLVASFFDQGHGFAAKATVI